jgi:hypothetical protein
MRRWAKRLSTRLRDDLGTGTASANAKSGTLRMPLLRSWLDDQAIDFTSSSPP